MKILSILLIVAGTTIACNAQPKYTGIKAGNNAPYFYFATAPSFDAPIDYRIYGYDLTVQKYSGEGGYDWGKPTQISALKLSREDLEEIAILAVNAVKEVSETDLALIENGLTDFTTDGTCFFLISNHFSFKSISVCNPPGDAIPRLEKNLKNRLDINENDN